MMHAPVTQHSAGVSGCVEWRRVIARPCQGAPATCRRRLPPRCCAHGTEDAGDQVQATRQTRRAAGVAAAALFGLGASFSAAQAPPAHALEAITIPIDMGDASGRLVFVPDRLTLKRNTLYKLVLVNKSSVYHNFVATDFLQSSLWLLTGMEQQSGDTEWYVLPRKLGLFPFYCTVTGHEQMKGVIEVVL